MTLRLSLHCFALGVELAMYLNMLKEDRGYNVAAAAAAAAGTSTHGSQGNDVEPATAAAAQVAAAVANLVGSQQRQKKQLLRVRGGTFTPCGACAECLAGSACSQPQRMPAASLKGVAMSSGGGAAGAGGRASLAAVKARLRADTQEAKRALEQEHWQAAAAFQPDIQQLVYPLWSSSTTFEPAVAAAAAVGPTEVLDDPAGAAAADGGGGAAAPGSGRGVGRLVEELREDEQQLELCKVAGEVGLKRVPVPGLDRGAPACGICGGVDHMRQTCPVLDKMMMVSTGGDMESSDRGDRGAGEVSEAAGASAAAASGSAAGGDGGTAASGECNWWSRLSDDQAQLAVALREMADEMLQGKVEEARGLLRKVQAWSVRAAEDTTTSNQGREGGAGTGEVNQESLARPPAANAGAAAGSAGPNAGAAAGSAGPQQRSNAQEGFQGNQETIGVAGAGLNRSADDPVSLEWDPRVFAAVAILLEELAADVVSTS